MLSASTTKVPHLRMQLTMLHENLAGGFVCVRCELSSGQCAGLWVRRPGFKSFKSLISHARDYCVVDVLPWGGMGGREMNE